MKKKLILTILISLFTIPAFAGVLTYTLYPVNYPIFVDGNPLQSNLPIMSYKDNTYVPLKAVLDMMGAKTEWNGSVNIRTSQADTDKIAESCVEIYVMKNGKDVSQASGVAIGYREIVTNSHVTDSGDSYRIVYNDGTVSMATLKHDNPQYDISVLEPIGREIKPVKIGDSDELKIGDSVFVISSPDEQRNVLSKGKIQEYNKFNNIDIIVTTANVDSGGSGGGVFNKDGSLIGILLAKGTGIYQGKTCMIPINNVRRAIM